MGIDVSHLLNEQINQILDTETLETVRVRLTPTLRTRLQSLAEAGGWDEDTALRLALMNGVSAELAESEHLSESELTAVANELGSKYVALRYQAYKLRAEGFREETRLNATRSQADTFRELIARLEGGSAR